MITAAQRKAFFTLFPRACDLQGILPGDREAYRHRLIREATGKESLTAVGPGTEFDRLMYRLAQEAQDYEAAMKYVTADARRLAKMAERAVMQCFAIAREQERDLYGYLKGLLQQAHLRGALTTRGAEWWLDLTLPQLHTVFQMLDTHRRRLLHRIDSSHRQTEDRTGYRVPMLMRFDLYADYRWEGEVLVHRYLDVLPEPGIHVRVINEEEAAYA